MLYKNIEIFTLPNLLSLSRIILAPVAFILFQWQSLTGQIITLIFFSLLFLTDFFDGFMARKMDQESELGRALDPLADKVLVFFLLIALVLFRGIPWWIFLIVIIRDLFIVSGGLFVMVKKSRVLGPNIWGKAGTFIMMASMAMFIFPDLWFLSLPSLVISLALIIFSFYTYVYSFFRIFIPSKRISLFLISLLVLISISIPLLIFSAPPSIYPKDFSEGAPSLDSEESQALLKQYAPVIYLDQNDPYIPIDIQAYLDNAALHESKGWWGQWDIKLTGPPLNLKKPVFESGKIYYTRLQAHPERISAAMANKYEKTVYARAIESPSGLILQYWFFFLGSEAGDTGLLAHEADWETIMIRLDQNLQPLEAGYSSHYYGNVKNYQEVEKENNKPIVYIAKGSHGAYFTKGNHNAYFDNRKKLRLASDRTSNDIKLDNEVYQLIPISEEFSWVSYWGYWGFPGFSLIQGPAFRSPHNQKLNLWSYPDKWLDFYRSK